MDQLFSPTGSATRLEYLFGYLWLCFFVMCLSIAGVRSLGLIYGPIWIGIAIILWNWGVIVLTIKRLRDLNLSGLHFIWIWLVNAAIPVFAIVSPKISMVLVFVVLSISLWLLFAPSQVTSGRSQPN